MNEVWLVTVIGGDCDGETHAFSTFDRAREFAERDDDVHLIYSSVVDHPEMASMVLQ